MSHNPYSYSIDTLLISLLNVYDDCPELVLPLSSLDELLPPLAPNVTPKIMPAPPPEVDCVWPWYQSEAIEPDCVADRLDHCVSEARTCVNPFSSSFGSYQLLGITSL